MKQFTITIILISSFTFFSQAQSKIYFEEPEAEFVFDLADIANEGLVDTDSLFMKSEHEDSIDVDWFLTFDFPVQDSLRVWDIGLCNELLCFFSESSTEFSEFEVTTVPPNYTYAWKLSMVTGAMFDNTDWFLGEGSVTLSVVNKNDENDTTSVKVNIKVIDSNTAINGCTDAMACNYDMAATEDDGSCSFESDACLDENGEAGVLNEACACVKVAVCADENACNNGETGDCLFVDCVGECGGSVSAGSACFDESGNESMYDDECNCIEVVGVEEFNLFSKAIFPNPSSGLINLEFIDANHAIQTIRVNNVKGQQVIILDGLEPSLTYQVDLSRLVKGLYQIQLVDKGGKLLYAEIIERQ